MCHYINHKPECRCTHPLCTALGCGWRAIEQNPKCLVENLCGEDHQTLEVILKEDHT